MTPSLLLFILRILMGMVLFTFLAAMLVMLRRDLRQTSPQRVLIPSAWLVLLEQDVDPSEFRLENINLIGRAADNTIVLENEIVSAHHARLSYVSGQQWWLEDLGSRNGTVVNDIPLVQPLAVTDGDLIVFGTVSCELRVEQGVQALEELPDAERINQDE